MKRILIFIAIASILLSNKAHSINPEHLSAKIDSVVSKYVKQGESGEVVGVVTSKGVLFKKAYLRKVKIKQWRGMYDISARLRLPKDLMTISMPYNLAVDITNEMDDSFVKTDNWTKIRERNLLNPVISSNI